MLISEPHSTTAFHVIVHGHVQGVGFRYSFFRAARNNEITGWVRNREDGTVEAYCEGQMESLNTLHQWLKNGGPPLARIDNVDWRQTETQGHTRFAIK